MRRRYKLSGLVPMVMLVTAGLAQAFPSWIGSCCGYDRHDGNNPGTFSILMNQDYYGLHADLVLQVNGGTWTTNAMTYVGNTGGNSIWQYTPSAAYQGGTVLRYAFHGYDDWGGSIWDSNYGSDYWHTNSPEWVGAARSNVTETVGNTERVLFYLDSAITNDAGLCEVIPLAPDLVRVRYHFTPGTNDLYEKADVAIDKAPTNWSSFTYSITNISGTVWIETDELDVECVTEPYFHVNFYDKSGYLLQAGIRFEFNEFYYPQEDDTYYTLSDSVASMPEGFKVKMISTMPDEEQYFGLGEYPGPLNKRDLKTQWWNSDTYDYGEFRNPVYMSLPILYGLQEQDGTNHPDFAYGLFFNNPARPVFDLQENAYDEYYIEAGDGQIDYFFLGGGTNHSLRNVYTRYMELIGAPAKFPKWAYGHHLARWSYGSQSLVETISAEAVSSNYPLDSIYLDLDYMDSYPDDYYEDNTLKPLSFSSNFSDPAGMISTVGSNGVKLVPIMEAWYTERTGDTLYIEMHAGSHTVKKYNGDPRWVTDHYFGDLWFFDYSSGPMREWWGGALSDFLQSYPFPGIWNDLNEPADPLYKFEQNDLYWLSDDTNQLYDASDSRRWHVNVKNTYCVYETEHTHHTLSTNFPEQLPFVLSRAGWPGIQRYAMNWSGDNHSSWGTMKFNIPMGVSTMMSGQPNFGHDIGGFVMPGGVPDDRPEGDLMTRWYQFATFNPLFRNHSAKFDNFREPWNYAEPERNYMRDTIHFRYKLMPYLYTLAYNSTQEDGIPMNTPTVFHFQSDTNTYNQYYDFMVGDQMLVAPVYEDNATSRWVYLPDDDTVDNWYQLHSGSYWYDWHNNDKRAAGTWVEIATSVGEGVPVFARDGAIIPQTVSMQYADESKPEYMDIHMWPSTNGSSSSWTLYEDDGISPTSAIAQTTFVNDNNASDWTATAEAETGSWDNERDYYVFILHDIDSFTNVTINSTSISSLESIWAVRTNATESYYHDTSNDELTVKVLNTGEEDEVKVEK